MENRNFKWWDLKVTKIKRIKDPPEWFKATFEDPVRLRMISDVPVEYY
jgi:hypothetical protein